MKKHIEVKEWLQSHKIFSGLILLSAIYAASMFLGFALMIYKGQVTQGWDMHLDVAVKAMGFYPLSLLSGFFLFRLCKDLKCSLITSVVFVICQNLFFMFFLAMNAWPITVTIGNNLNQVLTTYIWPVGKQLLISDLKFFPMIILGIFLGFADKKYHVKLIK